MRGAPASPSGSRASHGAQEVSTLTGFDPSRSVFAISSSACFYPEDDDPENFDGRMIAWTFAADKETRTGAGIYRLQLVRILTPEERGNTTAQLKALNALAGEAATAAKTPKSGLVHEHATAQLERPYWIILIIAVSLSVAVVSALWIVGGVL